MPPELAIAFRYGADFAEQLRILVQVIELIVVGFQKIDLVGCHQATEGKGITFEKGNDAAIDFRIVVMLAVDTPDRDIAKPEMFGPTREHTHNRGLSGRDSDEIEGWPFRGLQVFCRHLLLLSLTTICKHSACVYSRPLQRRCPRVCHIPRGCCNTIAASALTPFTIGTLLGKIHHNLYDRILVAFGGHECLF
jgi:hypothetical protein